LGRYIIKTTFYLVEREKMKNKEEIISKFWFDCSCGCGELVFSQWKDDGMAFISYHIPAFYAYQRNLWTTIKHRAKIIWNILRGKEFYLYEIVIEDNETLKRFKKFVSEMIDIEDET
jgi:hypothetical protein